ncbi:GNAT family N-acetyltransferase [Mucilaginibacter sp. PPCGB 2223]|uniref:GNAT family N-acetyltransferase n=1 Tax=Mucilaginibacter sp. PPCGB 2223 TaxID=1886027 RepID=UPI000824157F|nr:GNAT family N-acetyltransferase [Mucilaginibacter sp. PPCGB 2223]OCX51489.1 GNAT family N-acetyltransferase [Mucilaginibacter sp. PPCGB 2223]
MEPRIYIETPRLLLRDWILSDHQVFIDMNKDERVMEFFPSVLNDEETLASIGRIATQMDDLGYGLYAVQRKDDGRFIGFTGFYLTCFESHFTPCVEIGWRYSVDDWGQGFATEAALACLDYNKKILKIKDIYSFTAVLNKRSERVMQKIGMQYQGTFDHPDIAEGHPLRPHVLYRY